MLPVLDVVEALVPKLVIWVVAASASLAYAGNDNRGINDGSRGGGGGGHGGGGHSSGGGSSSGGSGGTNHGGTTYHGGAVVHTTKCYDPNGQLIHCPASNKGKLAAIIAGSIIGGILLIILLWFLWRRVLRDKIKKRSVGGSRGLPDAEKVNLYDHPDADMEGTTRHERRSTDGDSWEEEQKKPLKR